MYNFGDSQVHDNFRFVNYNNLSHPNHSAHNSVHSDLRHNSPNHDGLHRDLRFVDHTKQQQQTIYNFYDGNDMESNQRAQDSYSIHNTYEHRQYHDATQDIHNSHTQHQSQSQTIYNQCMQQESQKAYTDRYSPIAGGHQDEDDADGEEDKHGSEEDERDGEEDECDGEGNGPDGKDDISEGDSEPSDNTHNVNMTANNFTYPHPLREDEDLGNSYDPRLLPGGEMDLAGGFDLGSDDNRAQGFPESQLPIGELRLIFQRYIMMFTLYQTLMNSLPQTMIGKLRRRYTVTITKMSTRLCLFIYH